MALTLLVGAFAVALMALFGDESYGRLRSLSSSISAQKEINSGLEDKVGKLQNEIAALRFDDQELERRARKDLGLARPNELIFRFETDLETEVREMEEASNSKLANPRAAASKVEESKTPPKDNASALRRSQR
jgi:cell division protein FtsB